LSLLIKSIAESRFRVGPFDFTRGGDITPELLVTFLVYMAADANRRGIRHLLADFWNDAQELGLSLPRETPVSDAAICQVRQRLDPEVFRDLLYQIAESQRDGCSARGEARWHGRRVYAIDGQKVNLRRSSDLERYFGVPKGSNNPQAMYSALVDVCARMPVDFELSAHRSNERDHLEKMLESLEAGDLLLLDRGYPSHAVLQSLNQRGLDFLIRLPSSHTFSAVDRFRDSGQTDQVVDIEPPDDSTRDWRPLRLRLVRRETPKGPTFYLTSLHKNDLTRSDIDELYKMRWQVEEYFKTFASEYIGQSLFRSTMPCGVRQEFGALTVLLALSRVLAAEARTEIAKNEVYVSQKAAALCMGALFMKVSLASDATEALRFIERTMLRLLQTLDRHRPGRSHPRRSFKPGPKWGPGGRRGA
jgi:Transposase DDE domain